MKKEIRIIIHAFLLMLVTIIPVTYYGAIVSADTFVGPSAIVIDGSFSDWGTIESPISGAYFYQDASNTGLYDGSGFSGSTADLNYFWNAISTQNGGTEPASFSNPIQNVQYRIDTNSTKVHKGQSYFIQLNLGIAGQDYADHCLQLWVDDSQTPKVILVLYQYTPPYPEIGAFTTGAVTGMVSNVANPYSGYTGVVDTSAIGGIGLYDSSHYSVEVSTPISWYGPTYGGNIEADGMGAANLFGAVFSNTGNLGSVGVVKDTLNDSNGYLIIQTVDTITGDTVSRPAVKLTFTTESQTITAGEVSPVMTVQTQSLAGDPLNVTADINVNLITTSASGIFYSDAAGTTSTTSVTIISGTNSASFYYKDTLAGTPDITGAESPDQGWTNAVQQETITHAALDHFIFNTISAQTEGTAFGITIRALDAYGNTVISYTGTNSLSDSTGTITPASTGAFSSGVWSGYVTVTSIQTGVVITTTGGGKSGTSNSFDVEKLEDIEIAPREIIKIRLEIINSGQSETATIAMHYLIPEELIIRSVSVEPQGIASVNGNSLSVIFGVLESGNTSVVSITAEASSNIIAGTSLTGLLQQGKLTLIDEEALESLNDSRINDSLIISDLTIKPSEDKYWPLITFIKRIGEQVEISVEATKYESLCESLNGDYDISIVANELLLQKINIAFDGESNEQTEYDVELTINNTVWQKKEVDFDNNDRQKLVFYVNELDTGEFVVDIGGLQGQFTSSWWINWWLIVAIPAIVIGIGIGLLIWYMRGRIITKPTN